MAVTTIVIAGKVRHVADRRKLRLLDLFLLVESWLDRHDQRTDLKGLDDHILHDIGLVRGPTGAGESRRPFSGGVRRRGPFFANTSSSSGKRSGEPRTPAGEARSVPPPLQTPLGPSLLPAVGRG
jgi:uncharacterized protein YjiS (DUF1127 family)